MISRFKSQKAGWCVIGLISLTALGCVVLTSASQESPDANASTDHFLRPINPRDHFEAGDLWTMPAPDGRLRISPLRQWSRTGLELRGGQRLEIQAEGQVQGCQRPVGEWAYGPFGPSGGPAADNPESRVCALIGRIVGEGETSEFIVGESFQGEVPFSGRLDLGVSDVRHFDNSGEFVAAIRVDGRPADFTRRQAAALTAATKNLAPAMRPMNEVEIQELDGARRMSARREADRPMLATDQLFSPPLEIRARARTDSTNIRLYYGYFGWGQLIFNWEVRPDQLRVHDPATGGIIGVPGEGSVEKDKFHDIVWRVGLRQMQVLVDGEERYRGVGDYRAVASPVGIGPAWGSRVDVESLVVAPPPSAVTPQTSPPSAMSPRTSPAMSMPKDSSLTTASSVHKSASTHQKRLAVGERPDDLEFLNREVGTMRLPQLCTIHGRVVEATPDVSSENLARLDSAKSLDEVGDILKRILGNGPAPGVVVVLRSGAITRETTTDSEGRFTFSGVPAEACELFVKGELAAPPSWEGDSHVATAKRAMSRDEVKSGFPVTLELRADYITVSGRITNAAKQPIAGVKVTGVSVFKSIDQYSWVESGRYSTVSDANGYYEFRGLTPENVYRIAGAGDTSGLESLEIRTEVDGFRPGMVRVPLVSEDLLKPAQRLNKSLEPLYLKWGEGKGKSLPKSKRPELNLPSSKGSRITGIDIVLDPAGPADQPSSLVGDVDFLRPLQPDDPRETGAPVVTTTTQGLIRVSPLRQWSDTLIDVKSGQRLQIRAQGQVYGCPQPAWAYGPWGPDGGDSKGTEHYPKRLCALIGRIVQAAERGFPAVVDSREFLVGESLDLTAPIYGRFFLGVSDIWHFDNSGEFSVEVRIDGKTQHPDPAKTALGKPADQPTSIGGVPVTSSGDRHLNDGPPAIVDTSPKVGASEVNPNLAEITVTFDREMAGGFSWTGGGAYYPPGREGEKPHWSADRRTCSFPVKLEAGKYYRIGINSKSHQNFKSAAGVPARPAAIYFTTRGASEDLKAMAGKPHVVSMEPASGARDVDPAITELRVTFDVPMGGGFSWTGGGPEFPKGREGQRPHWTEDGRICVFPVTLEPGKSYRLGLNSPSHKNFSSRGGVPLDPVVYTFSTKDEH